MIEAEAEIKLFETNDKNIKELIASMSMMNGKIELKVSKGEIISTINQSAEKIKIDANMIDLNGYVTVSSLSGEGTTTIDGSNIKTGMISADRLDVDSIFAKDITATGSITGVTLNGATGSFTGQIEAGTGKIGGFNITDTGLHSGTEGLTSKVVGVYVGIDGIRNVGSHGTVDITDGWIGFDKMYFNGGNNNTDVAIEGWSNAQSALDRFQIKLNGDATFRAIETLQYDIKSGRNLTAEGYITAVGTIKSESHISTGGHFFLTNNKYLLGKDTSGTNITLIGVSTNNNVAVGYGSNNLTTIYGGKGIRFYLKNYVDANNNPRGYKPYYEPDDSFAVYWDGAGFITNSATNVRFTIPVSRPILFEPTVSIINIQGLRIRQNGKYLYDSAGWTTKATYKAVAGTEWIRITAVLPRDLDAINDGPCGIEANIKITFSI